VLGDEITPMHRVNYFLFRPHNNTKNIYNLRFGTQALTLQELKHIKNLPEPLFIQSYLEAVHRIERYCALVDTKNIIIRNNAKKYMDEYEAFKRLPFKDPDEYYLLCKDYERSTRGQSLEYDAKVITRAKHFYRHFKHICLHEYQKSLEKVRRLIQKDISPDVAFMCLQRAKIAHSTYK
jgi:hypothetical protein